MFLGCTFLYTQEMVYSMQKVYTSINLDVQIQHTVEMVYSKHNGNPCCVMEKYFMSHHSSRSTNKTILVCATDTRDCYEFSYCTVWEGIQM